MPRLSPLILALLLAACVAPDATTKLDPLSAALIGRSVDFTADPSVPKAERAVQSWTADGRTTMRNMGLFGGDMAGRWKVQNGHYCNLLGTSTEWTCMRVTFSQGGTRIRFKEIPKDLGDWLINIFAVDRTGTFLPAE